MNWKLLVVDDEQEIVDMIQRYFRLEGYEIEGTTDPKEALEIVNEGECHVLISDIKMPEMSGVELLRKVKKADGIVQVIMITGYVTVDNIVNCLEYGANDCLFKPFEEMDELKRSVDETIRKLERWHEVIGELRGMKEEESA